MDQLQKQKQQSLFQQEQKKESLRQGNVLEQRQEMLAGSSAYVSEAEKTKDRAFFSEDAKTEQVISKVKDKALTPSDQKAILEDDRRFRTRAGIRL